MRDCSNDNERKLFNNIRNFILMNRDLLPYEFRKNEIVSLTMPIELDGGKVYVNMSITATIDREFW